MRLLFTTFTFAPQANGVAQVVGAQAFGLARRGHDVTVATEHLRSRSDLTSENVTIVQFNISDRSAPADEVRRYQEFVANAGVDFIIAHCWRSWPTDLAFPVITRNAAKTIFVSHGYTAHRWSPSKRFAWGLGQWLKAQPYFWRTFRMLRKFDHIVFLSQRTDYNRFFDHKLVNFLGTPPFSVIPNGAHSALMVGSPLNFRAQFAIRERFILLCVSTYADNKNQEGALRAFRRAQLPDACLVFIGNEFNAYTEKLRRLDQSLRARFLGGEVIFLEKVNSQFIQAAYEAADAVVLSSKGETQPLVILSAMAAGKPFVSTNVGCVSELPGGLVVADERAMAHAIRKLYDDAELRGTLGRAGIEACRRTYNWELVLDAYEGLFKQLAK